MVKSKSPAAINLDEFIAHLKANNLEMSEDIKKIWEAEQTRKKVEKTPTQNVPHSRIRGNTANVTSNTQSTVSSNTDSQISSTPKKAKEALTNFLGKDTAKKLIKKDRNDVSPETKDPRELKEIKANLDEIHEYLLGQRKPLGVAKSKNPTKTSPLKKLVQGFVRGAFGINTGSKNHGLLDALEPRRGKQTKKISNFFTAKKTTRKITKPTKSKSEPKVQRIPITNVPAAIQNIQTSLNSDQTQAQHTKEEVEQETEAKTTHEKLDKILHILDDMKKRMEGLNKRGLGIMGLVGVVMGLLKKSWSVIRNISKAVAAIGEKIAKFIGTIVKKGWEALKKVFTKGGAAAEEAAEVGEGAAALSKASKLGKIARVGGKALGVAGAALDVGTGIYDLTQGKRQSEMPTGLDMLSPMKWGMYAGEKINQGVAKVNNGEDLSEMISRIGEKDVPINPSPKPLPKPKLLPQAFQNATMTQNQMASEKAYAPQLVVVQGGNKTTVLPSSPTSAPVVNINARNPEFSADMVNGGLFDAPQGYNALYRM